MIFKKKKNYHIKKSDNKKYDNYVAFIFRFNKGTDSDIILKLNSLRNRTEYIRVLIRNDIEREEK